MFKYLFYVSVLLSTSSSHLLAMDPSETEGMGSGVKSAQSLTQLTMDSDRKLIAKSTPPVLQMFAKEVAEKELKKGEISFYFKNTIPGLERGDLKEVEINSNTLPYTILNPLEDAGTPAYLADGNANLYIYLLTKAGELQQGKTIPLPLNTSYGEPLKLSFQEPKRKDLDLNIQFRGTVYRGGQITDGKWTPRGEPEFISASLWCPVLAPDSVYVDITSNVLKSIK